MTEIDEREHHATLTCVAGKYAGKTFHVTNEATIGRNGENQILLDAMVVSNRHARVYFDNKIGAFVIEDLGSRTGIMLDEEFVDDRSTIRDGQRITIANEFAFTFQIGIEREHNGAEPAEASRTADVPLEDTRAVQSEWAPHQSAENRHAGPSNEQGTDKNQGTDKKQRTDVGGKATPEPTRQTPATAAGASVYYLERTGTDGEQITYTLSDGINLVGRDPSNTIHLQDSSVSRHHAVIVVKDGTLLVRDLDSKNHTFVDGVRVEHEREMKPGSVVLFGLMAFVVREQD